MTASAPLPLVLIAAVAHNGVIGDGHGMPWRLPGDMAHFRTATMGNPVLMGRKTFESIGRPLPGRPTIVLTGNHHLSAPGVTVASSLSEALERANEAGLAIGAECIMVAGGATLYEALLPKATRLLITDVESRPAGTVRFPDIDRTVWTEAERTKGHPHPGDTAPYCFVRFERCSVQP